MILSKCELIINEQEFLKSSVEVMTANKGNDTFKPYTDRFLKYCELKGIDPKTTYNETMSML